MIASHYSSQCFQMNENRMCIFGLLVDVCADCIKMGYCDSCGAISDCNMRRVTEYELSQKCLKFAEVIDTHRQNGDLEQVETLLMSHLMLAYLYASNEISFESFKGIKEERMDIPKHKDLKVVWFPSVKFINHNLTLSVMVADSSDRKFGECSFVFMDSNGKAIM